MLHIQEAKTIIQPVIYGTASEPQSNLKQFYAKNFNLTIQLGAVIYTLL